MATFDVTTEGDDPRLPGPYQIAADAAAFAAALADSQAAVSQYQSDAAAFQDGEGNVGNYSGGEGNL